MKYGPLFADQSKRTESRTELHNNKTETQNEQEKNKSQTHRIVENVYNVNKTEQSEITTSWQSDISTPNCSRKSTIDNNEKMNQENFYHWRATRNIVEIVRRRNKSLETRRLVEQKNTLSRPDTMRRRYDHQSQRKIFPPSRPNKRSREEIAEIDAELMRKAIRLGGRFQPIQEEPEDNPEEWEIGQGPEDTEKIASYCAEIICQ